MELVLQILAIFLSVVFVYIFKIFIFFLLQEIKIWIILKNEKTEQKNFEEIWKKSQQDKESP